MMKVGVYGNGDGNIVKCLKQGIAVVKMIINYPCHYYVREYISYTDVCDSTYENECVVDGMCVTAVD